jgi:hypothetical protein
VFSSCLIASIIRRQTPRQSNRPPRKVLPPYRAFDVRLIAVAFQHQVGDAPDVNLWDHADRLLGERLSRVNTPVDQIWYPLRGSALGGLRILPPGVSTVRYSIPERIFDYVSTIQNARAGTGTRTDIAGRREPLTHGGPAD